MKNTIAPKDIEYKGCNYHVTVEEEDSRISSAPRNADRDSNDLYVLKVCKDRSGGPLVFGAKISKNAAAYVLGRLKGTISAGDFLIELATDHIKNIK